MEDWEYDLEEKIEERMDYHSDDNGYKLFIDELGTQFSWRNVEKIKQAKNTINMRLEWLYKSVSTVDEAARTNTIQWYRDNEDVDGMSDDEIEDIDGFWDMVESDLQIYWDDILEEYKSELEDLGPQNDEHALLNAISDAQDEMQNLIDKLEKYISESKREMIVECWYE